MLLLSGCPLTEKTSVGENLRGVCMITLRLLEQPHVVLIESPWPDSVYEQGAWLYAERSIHLLSEVERFVDRHFLGQSYDIHDCAFTVY